MIRSQFLLSAWALLLTSSANAFIPNGITITTTTHQLQTQQRINMAMPVNMVSTSSSTSSPSSSHTDNDYTEDDIQDDLTSRGLLKRDRYVATNRFAVRPGKEAKFEARWANRKSRLATLDGFKYFHLMRRVSINQEDDTTTYDMGNSKDDSTLGNYVSFTIWEKKSHFSAWRKGDAFKEAHGGTSLVAFITTLVSSARTLQGAPRPAFYDGLLQQSITPESTPTTIDGWRQVESDGKATLPTECFIACNQFYVPQENAVPFEQRWKNRESVLAECDGFVSFSMLRRDGQAKGHGIKPVEESEATYLSTTIWRDRAAFQAWTKSNSFRKAHSAPASSSKGEDGETKAPPSPPQPLWSKPPVPVFYEGTLVISSTDGA